MNAAQERKERAVQTRAENEARRSAAIAQSAESKAQIMAALAQVTNRADATTEQILEAARLAVELHSRGY